MLVVITHVFSKYTKLYPVRILTTNNTIDKMERYIQDTGKMIQSIISDN